MNHSQPNSEISNHKFSGASVIFTIIGIPLIFLSYLVLSQTERELGQFENVQAKNLQQISKRNNSRDGETVLITDDIMSKNKTLHDPRFDVTIEGLKVYRKSYTYLWTENRYEKRKPSLLTPKNESQYAEYYKEWIADDFKWSLSSRKSNNSNRFVSKEGHENPSVSSLNFMMEHPEGLIIGEYSLGKNLYEAIKDFGLVDLKDHHLPENHSYQIDSINESKCLSFKMDLGTGNHIGEVQNVGKANSIFIGNGTPEYPQIGDKRIEYWRVKQKPYTVVGRIVGDSLIAIKNKSSFISSKSTCRETRLLNGYFGILYPGRFSKKQIFDKVDMEYSNHQNTWRFVGYFMMVFAFLCVTHLVILILNSITNFSELTKSRLFNLFGLFTFCIPLAISITCFLKYNSFSNLGMKDYYFAVTLLLCILVGLLYFRTNPKGDN